MNRKTPILHIIIFLLLLVTAGGLYVMTQNVMIKSNLKEAEIKSLTDNKGKLDALTASLPTLTSEESDWKKYLPANEEDVAAFASSIEDLAKAQSLDITLDFDDFPGQVDIGGKYVNGLGLSITLEGSYQGLTRFMAGLDGLPYFYKTDKITALKPETKVGVKTTIKGSLIMAGTK